MNDEIKKSRGPTCPKHSLEQALEIVKILFGKAGRSKVKPVVAAGALGYSGLNGAAATALASVNQYGLIEREAGESILVSDAAVKILHSVSEEQKSELLRSAALKPKVFADLYAGGFKNSDPLLISKHLIQNCFGEESANKGAEVFLSNVSFANLKNESINLEEEVKTEVEKDVNPNRGASGERIKPPAPPISSRSFNFPLPGGEATLTVTFPLTEAAFSALNSTIQGFKEGLVRSEVVTIDTNEEGYENKATKLAESRNDFDVKNFSFSFDFELLEKLAKANGFDLRMNVAKGLASMKRKGDFGHKFPANAIWKNKDFDKPVVITGAAGLHKGITFYTSEDGTGIPETELTFK